ncbi:hypothetical protein TIFTF001_019498 [Ficus carica]|uniref:E3 ubiquitin-protein ligase PRT1 n=1 Tax=Ficus carica TaxID=3494 RepID=A0AA88AX00_FICCA|nr:hypothetical protein TIFTF001_019498 [Ficus carica]
MGDHASEVAESEEIAESFVCCVCLNPYNHFPTICQMLHFLLLKMYPLAYGKRELQILEEENREGCFSPQLDDNANGAVARQELHHLSNSACEESTANMEQLDPVSQIQDSCTRTPEEAPDENFKVTGTVTDNKMDSPRNRDGGNCELVTVADVLCVECKQLVFRPVVLNCGHVYCESCLIPLSEEIIRCRICQSSHPKGLPKVCLELCQFLEEHFPKEYALRRVAIQLKQVKCSTDADKQARNVQWWSDPGSNVHFSVGCDSCGMYPIIGDRYKCKDCVEEIGFDLCGDCYNTSSKLPGRFNQQHTPEHKFELRQSNTIRNIMLRLVTGQIEDGSAALVFGNHSSENSEDGSTALVIGNHSSESSDDGSTPFSLSGGGGTPENADNSSAVAPDSSPGGGQDQDSAQSPT